MSHGCQKSAKEVWHIIWVFCFVFTSGLSVPVICWHGTVTPHHPTWWWNRKMKWDEEEKVQHCYYFFNKYTKNILIFKCCSSKFNNTKCFYVKLIWIKMYRRIQYSKKKVSIKWKKFNRCFSFGSRITIYAHNQSVWR